MFALNAHLMRGDPDERIEPEERDGKLCKELRQRIEAFDVCHLVHQHEAAAFFRPAVGVLRQKNRWINDSPRHWHGQPFPAQQCQRTRDAEPVGETLRERQPDPVLDASAIARELTDSPGPKSQAEQHEQSTDEPYGRQNGNAACSP